MSLSPAKTTCLALALLPSLSACNQLEPIEEETGGGGGGIPPAVRAAFEQSCGKSGGCHDGVIPPMLKGPELEAILTSSGGNGIPYVTIGDPANSFIALVLLSDATLDEFGVARPAPRMPFDGDFFNPNVSTIVAWIAGVEFEGGDDPTTGDPTTGDPSTTSTTTGEPAMPTFTNVQAIFDNKCSCHLSDPGLGNLNLSSGAAYANIVGVTSPTTTLNLVEPGDPMNSYLYLKLAGGFEAVGGTGTLMPQGGMLTPDELMLVEEWITMGAMNN